MITALMIIAGATFAAQATTTVNTLVKTDNGQAKVSLRIKANVDLKKEIEAAKKYKAELIAEVKAGKVSKEEAKAKWSAKIQEVKAKKKAYFEARFKRLEEKKEKLEKIAPEVAKKIENRLALIKEKKEKISKVRMELKAEVEAGKISKKELREKMKVEVKAVREEAGLKRIAFVKQFKFERKSLREDFKKRIAEKRALIKEVKSDFGVKFGEEKGKIKADLKAKIDADKKARMEIRTKVEAGEISLDEAKEKVKALREERKKIKKMFFDDLKSKKEEIHEKQKNKVNEEKNSLREEFKKRKEKKEKIKKIKEEFKDIESIVPSLGNGIGGEMRICTREYMPVCAKVGGEIKTFSNKCMAGENEILYKGKCKTESEDDERGEDHDKNNMSEKNKDDFKFKF